MSCHYYVIESLFVTSTDTVHAASGGFPALFSTLFSETVHMDCVLNLTVTEYICHAITFGNYYVACVEHRFFPFVGVWCTQNPPRWQQLHEAPAMPVPKVHHFGGYTKVCYEKLFTHVESHAIASAVSLLESGEKRHIKAINNYFCCRHLQMEMFAQFCFQDRFHPASDSATVLSCLFSVKEKFQKREYKTITEFVTDVRRMIYNCCSFILFVCF